MAERPEDLNLPNAVVTRIIKDALPEGVNVSKDARLAISKAASVFVLYATSCANNFAMVHKRKTISGNDVIEAMSEMEFERFVDPLRTSLTAYKKGQQGKKEASEKKKKEKQMSAVTEEASEEATEESAAAGDDSTSKEPMDVSDTAADEPEVVQLDDD